MKRHIYQSLVFGFLVISIGGCGDDFLNRQPPSSLTEETFYQTAGDAVSAVNAAYASLQTTSMYSENYPKLVGAPSDDVLLDNTGGLGFDNFTFAATEGPLDVVWQASYEGVFRANLVLQEVPNIEMDESLKNRVLGEAKFLRALYYWHLTTLYGDVPLITEADAEDPSKAEVGASPKSEVYALMIQDLQEAAETLPLTYDDAEVGRATKGAAQALLGKVYLYDQNYAEAEKWLAAVINSDVYGLLPDFGDVMAEGGENSIESVFEVQYQNVGGGAWGGTDAATLNETNLRMSLNLPQGRGGYGNHLPTQDLVNEFEDWNGASAINGKDPRLFHSIFMEGDPYDETDPVYSAAWTVTGYAIKKGMLPIIRFNDFSNRNVPLIRFADVLLMYAEAANENGNSQEALDALNTVRARAGMPPYPTAEYPADNKDQVFDAIVHERRVELAFEYHRYHDLRRWGLAEEQLEALGYDPRHRYFPYPQAEVDVNQELEQKPDY